MTHTPALSRFNLTRFDGFVLAILLGLALLVALMIWRGDRIGVQVVNFTPAEQATGVSTQTFIRVTFDQTIVAAGSVLPLSFDPPLTGTTRWEGATLTFRPATPLTPDTTYTVTVDDRLESIEGRSIQGNLTWQFQTGRPRVLYAAPDAAGIEQLFVIDPAGGEPDQLTEEAFGIADYALSPDGTVIAYAAVREDQGSDLWTITPNGRERASLLPCPEAVCGRVAWVPDGRRFIYERRNFIIPGAAPGPPRLWWFDLATGETAPVFEDTQAIGYGASWSPDGQWLGYVSPDTQGIQIYNINDGRNSVVTSRMGGIPVWSPQENTLLVTDILAGDEGFAVHLLRVTPERGELIDLSESQPGVEDGSPVWSPDGAWIAFTRKSAGATMGKQIWLMRPDGSQARYLTSDPEIHHGLPAWSPDGRYLLYQRFPLKEVGTLPSVWLLDLETETARELVSVGNRPVWLP